MGWITQFQGDTVRYMSVHFEFWAAWSTDSYGQNGDGNGLLTVRSAFWPLTCGFRSQGRGRVRRVLPDFPAPCSLPRT